MIAANAVALAATLVAAPLHTFGAQDAAAARDTTGRIDRTALERAHAALMRVATGDSSMKDRHARVTSAVGAELRSLAGRDAANALRVSLRGVPLTETVVDVASGGISVTDYPASHTEIVHRPVPLGPELWPVIGPPETRFPLASRVEKKRMVFGGRLGTRDAAPPASVRDEVVVFLPPVRTDGSPDYQVWAYRRFLEPYQGTAAILIATRDVIPPGSLWTRSIDVTPATQPAGTRTSPRAVPVAAISRIVASRLLDIPIDGALPGHRPGIKVSLLFDVGAQPIVPVPQNVVAIIEGSDEQLKSEFVVVSTRLIPPAASVGSAYAVDRRGGEQLGSAALVALAHSILNGRDRPKRSVVLLWSSAWADRAFGAEQLLGYSDIPRERIRAAVSLDVFVGDARGPRTEMVVWRDASQLLNIDDIATRWSDTTSLALERRDGARAPQACASDAWRFARAGIPSVGVQFTPTEVVEKPADMSSLRDVTSLVESLLLAAANTTAQLEPASPRPSRPGVC